MVTFPNCKINLGLRIVAKRSDGYHDLETVFYPVPIRDALEVLELSNGQKDRITLSGIPVAGIANDNLCLRAVQMLRNDFPGLPFLDIYLHKAIPVGAGLGGGSADGAFVLKLVDEKFDLHLPEDRLRSYAGQLGSDCPFFIINKPAIATGRGEILQPINLDLSGLYLAIHHPQIHISTADAFRSVSPGSGANRIIDVISLPVEQWKDHLINDFEESVFLLHPQIASIKKEFYEMGALYASMSGSGSSVYGIFRQEPPSANPGTVIIPL